MRDLNEVFPDAQTAQAYERMLDSLWYHGIVEAHEAIKAAKSVLEAPVEFLLDPGPAPTLGWLANILLERAALKVINALTDDTAGALTLQSLRSQLLTKCNPQHREELAAELHRGFSNADFGEIRERAIRHRHTFLAHLTRGIFEKADAWSRSRLALHELEDLLAKARQMLDVLSIHGGRGYDLVRHSEDDSLAFIVETTMRTSTLLNMPEMQGPLVFRAFAERFTPSQRELFAAWRKHFGLPEVELPPPSQ